MTKLLQKDVKFVWCPACEEAFQALKKFLTSTLVLAQLDIDKPFDVYCDASDWIGMCAYAGWACDSLCFMPAEKARGELSYP